MPPRLAVLWDGDESRPEVAVCGAPSELSRLAVLLTNIKAAETVALQSKDSTAYPACLGRLTIEPSGDARRLEVAVEADTLRIRGGTRAMEALAQSLLNFFEGEVKGGDHFHLDYYEGNELLEPTPCTLVFQSE